MATITLVQPFAGSVKVHLSLMFWCVLKDLWWWGFYRLNCSCLALSLQWTCWTSVPFLFFSYWQSSCLPFSRLWCKLSFHPSFFLCLSKTSGGSLCSDSRWLKLVLTYDLQNYTQPAYWDDLNRAEGLFSLPCGPCLSSHTQNLHVLSTTLALTSSLS